MTPFVPPEHVQHVLRHPALDERALTPTRFTPAATKAWFAVMWTCQEFSHQLCTAYKFGKYAETAVMRTCVAFRSRRRSDWQTGDPTAPVLL